MISQVVSKAAKLKGLTLINKLSEPEGNIVLIRLKPFVMQLCFGSFREKFSAWPDMRHRSRGRSHVNNGFIGLSFTGF
jgi:hypothetical protein